MKLSATLNVIVLNSRPFDAPTVENFRLEESTVPVPSAGEVLLRTQLEGKNFGKLIVRVI